MGAIENAFYDLLGIDVRTHSKELMHNKKATLASAALYNKLFDSNEYVIFKSGIIVIIRGGMNLQKYLIFIIFF